MELESFNNFCISNIFIEAFVILSTKVFILVFFPLTSIFFCLKLYNDNLLYNFDALFRYCMIFIFVLCKDFICFNFIKFCSIKFKFFFILFSVTSSSFCFVLIST